MKKISLLIILTVFVFLTACTAKTSNNAYKIGDTIEINNIKVTVNSAKIIPSDKTNVTKIEGDKFLSIDATVKNEGQETVLLSELAMFSVINEEGIRQTYSIHTDRKVDFDRELGPGQKITGQIICEIPGNAQAEDFRLVFDPNVFDPGQVVIRLGN